MADLAIGDEVFGPNGRRLSVLAATEPMMNRQCFSVNRKTFSFRLRIETTSMKSCGRLALALGSLNDLHERLGFDPTSVYRLGENLRASQHPHQAGLE